MRLDAEQLRLEKTEIDAFIGVRWLVTVRADDRFAMDDVVKRWDSDPTLTAQGVGIMVYSLLDDVVDGYFSVVDQFDSYYEGVGDSVFADRPLQPGQEARVVRDAPRPLEVPPARPPAGRSANCGTSTPWCGRGPAVLAGPLRPHRGRQRDDRRAARLVNSLVDANLARGTTGRTRS